MSAADFGGTDPHGEAVAVALTDLGSSGDPAEAAVAIVIDPPQSARLSPDAPGPDRIVADLTGETVVSMVHWLAHRGIIDLDELAGQRRAGLAEIDALRSG